MYVLQVLFPGEGECPLLSHHNPNAWLEVLLVVDLDWPTKEAEKFVQRTRSRCCHHCQKGGHGVTDDCVQGHCPQVC